MTFRYENVVPWGRNFDEYRRMFALDETDLRQRIIGCGDGPASFNAQATRRGLSVVSVDPIYAMSVRQIRQRIDETFRSVITQTRNNLDKFVWDEIETVENLGRLRMAAMEEFLEDFESGVESGRYLSESLPELSLDDRSFDLALSSHFLFLHGEHLDLDFHVAAINEMLRVAREVRIFPLLDVNAQRSPYVAPIVDAFTHAKAEVRHVDYEFQRGGNQMLMLRSQD